MHGGAKAKFDDGNLIFWLRWRRTRVTVMMMRRSNGSMI